MPPNNDDADLCRVGILPFLEGIKRVGYQVSSRCPFHPDETPSFSVDSRTGLWTCFAGCGSGNAAQFYARRNGIDEQSAYHELKSLVDNRNGKLADLGHRLGIPFDYHDEAGILLYQNVRIEKLDGKEFFMRRPNGRGGWINKMGETRRVPFRLRELLASKGTVLVTEGEKCVEAALARIAESPELRELDLAVTTTAGGANSWRPEFTQYFRNRDVILLPDNDEGGRHYVEDAARWLIGVSRTVRIVDLASEADQHLGDLGTFAEGGDIVDYLELGGEVEDVLKIAEAMPALTRADLPAHAVKNDGAKPALSLVSVGDLLAEPAEDVRWLLEEVLPAGGLSLLASKPKVGKSTWARCLALNVARGAPFMNLATQKGMVIYLALEEKRGELREHFRSMGATEGDEILIHAAHAEPGAWFELRKLAEQRKPALIIVDPLFRLMRVADGNSYAELTAALEPFMVLARETGAHVLVIHHAGKGKRSEPMDSILGSTAIFGGVDSALIMKRSERYRTIQSQQRYGKDLPETVLDFDERRGTISLGAAKSEAETLRIGEAILKHLSGCDEAQTEVAIGESVEGKNAWKRSSLRDLAKAGKVTRTGKGGRGDPFLYSCTPAIGGTSVQETEKVGYRLEDEGHILVRAAPDNSQPSESLWVQESETCVGCEIRAAEGLSPCPEHLSKELRPG